MNKWVVLTQPACGHCIEAKALLDRKGIEFVEFNVSESPILKKFIVSQGLLTVPQVYNNGMRIGGYAELKRFFEQ